MKTILLAAALFVAGAAGAQSTLNFGIPRRQPEEALPQTKAPAPQTERKPKANRSAVLMPCDDHEYVISGAWEMTDAASVVSQPILNADYNTSKWLDATIPGTVLTTLVEQGVYPDPYYGLNNLLIPDSLCRMDWWYRIRFDAPAGALEEAPRLLFNGINYRAEIWLNGRRIGSMAGAFNRGYFDVRNLLKQTDNVLAVRISPPDNPGIAHEQNSEEFGPNGGALCLDGPTFIVSEGWDWMPAIRDRNAGIWQDVRLCLGNGVVFGDVQVVTDLSLPDTTRAEITMRVPLHNTDSRTHTFRLAGRTEGLSFGREVELAAGEQRTIEFTPQTDACMTVKNPRLWWPNGYGAQNLYTLKLETIENGRAVNSKTTRFGIREFTYELAVDMPERENVRIEYSPTNVKQKGKILFDFTKLRDANVPNRNTFIPSVAEGVNPDNFIQIEQTENPYIVLKVNGQPVFCKGGNWGIDDAMKRVSRATLEPAFKLHQLENFNMIRNWTGECTEQVFFELCDEYGMLVWNDFWMSTGKYNLLPLDYDLFLSNVTDVVRRFRNHPSIAIWCPRNEGYAEGLEKDLQHIILSEDGTRHYHGNSRELNMPGSGPWGYHDQPVEYFNRLAYGFNSELGSNSIPPYSTFKKFIAEEDRWPIGDLWYYHDYHVHGWSGWDALHRDMDRLSSTPCTNAEEYCRRADVLNYNGHKIMFEAYNHKMWGFTSGVLYWMSHPAWPSLICQTYSYDYQTFGTFYGCKKACEPTHIQWNINNWKIVVANPSLNKYLGANVSFAVYDLAGRQLSRHDERVDVRDNERVDLREMPLPATLTDLVLVRLTLKDRKGKLISDNDYWYKEEYSNAPAGFCDMAETTLKLSSRKNSDGSLRVTVRNAGATAAALVRVNVVDVRSDDPVLPAYASDNYFNLLPGESRSLNIKYPAHGEELNIKAEGVNCLQYVSLNGK